MSIMLQADDRRMCLQAEIIQHPESFVELDPEMAYTLLDLKRAVKQPSPAPAFVNAAGEAPCATYGPLAAALQLMFSVLLQGKLILLITNSDYQYTERMMSFAYDRYLKAEGMQWRDLFDMVSCRAFALRLTSAVLYYSPAYSAIIISRLLSVDICLQAKPQHLTWQPPYAGHCASEKAGLLQPQHEPVRGGDGRWPDAAGDEGAQGGPVLRGFRTHGGGGAGH